MRVADGKKERKGASAELHNKERSAISTTQRVLIGGPRALWEPLTHRVDEKETKRIEGVSHCA